MLPGGLLALLLAVALVPGWLYLHLNRRLEPARSRSGLDELLEVVAIGLLTTGSAVSAVLLLSDTLPERFWPGWLFIELSPWASQGASYLAEHARQALVTGLTVLVAASAMAWLTHHWRRRKQPPEFVAASVWAHALGSRPKGCTHVWAGVHLVDGTLAEGVLDSIDLDDSAKAGRDLALKAPIFTTSSDGVRQKSELHRLVLPDGRVAHIGVRHLVVRDTAAKCENDSPPV